MLRACLNLVQKCLMIIGLFTVLYVAVRWLMGPGAMQDAHEKVTLSRAPHNPKSSERIYHDPTQDEPLSPKSYPLRQWFPSETLKLNGGKK